MKTPASMPALPRYRVRTTVAALSWITCFALSLSLTLFWESISMLRTRLHWSHRKLRVISKLRLRAMIALLLLSVLAQLSGCSSTKTVYVPVPPLQLPASLTAETPYPDIPDNMTWGGSLDLNVSLLSALGQCNRDKADIRAIEQSRASQ